jgi:hypothetical protein
LEVAVRTGFQRLLVAAATLTGLAVVAGFLTALTKGSPTGWFALEAAFALAFFSLGPLILGVQDKQPRYLLLGNLLLFVSALMVWTIGVG